MKSNPLKIYLRYAKKRGWLKPMASNLHLTELEQDLLEYIQNEPGLTSHQIVDEFWGTDAVEVRQAIGRLVLLNFISADENLRYSAAGKEL